MMLTERANHESFSTVDETVSPCSEFSAIGLQSSAADEERTFDNQRAACEVAEALCTSTSLDRLDLGDEGVVVGVECSNPQLRNKLLSMGVIRDTLVRVTQVAPLGDPISILVRGFTLSLRRSEARSVLIGSRR